MPPTTDIPVVLSPEEEELHVGFMRMAMELGREAAQCGEVPVGALVVHRGKVIATASNRRESDADPTAHAELMAIRKAAEVLGNWRLEECTVYVTLEPCPMCAGAMVMSRIARCVYGCSDPKGGYLGTLHDLSNVPELNHRFEVVGGILADACSEQLRTFFRELRAKRKRQGR